MPLILQQNNLALAVKSAYTYLVANPKDRETLDNLAFYMEQDGYDENMLIDALQMKYEVCLRIFCSFDKRK